VPTFKAIVVEKGEGGQKAGLADFDEANLMDGDVTVRVEWSTVNYKDGLALTGKAPVIRRFPMIPGIDFAGTVESSSHPQWKPGDRVILNGWGAGETHLGGYAEKARVKGDWLVGLPARNSARGAMAIGTAGYTAMLAVMALERQGVAPRHGPVIVTGAAGGVGSVAVTLLAKLGFAVVASEVKSLSVQTGKATEDIARHIQGVQSSTRNAIDTLRKIAGRMQETNEYAGAVAIAVEQQNSAITEISENAASVAQRTQIVSSVLGEVASATTETRGSADIVRSASESVEQAVSALQREVEQFLQKVAA